MLFNLENEMDENRQKLSWDIYRHEGKDSSSLQVTNILTFNEIKKQGHFQLWEKKRLLIDYGNERSSFQGDQ